MQKFYTNSMLEITTTLQKKLKTMQAKEKIKFEVLNPDIASSTYSGNLIRHNNHNFVYRSYKSWIDLAHILSCRMLTPQIQSDATIIIIFEKLNPDESFHKSINDKEEKYGKASIFGEGIV